MVSISCYEASPKTEPRSDMATIPPESSPELEKSAAQKVGQIVELVEEVLYHLPFIEVLSAKLVCKHWHDMVNRSLPLQQKLFLAPMTYAPELRLPGYILPYEASYEPVTHRKEGPYIVQPWGGRQWHPLLQYFILTPRWFLKYTLEHSFLHLFWVQDTGMRAIRREIKIPDVVLRLKYFATAPDGEWQRALCCQPPIQLLEYELDEDLEIDLIAGGTEHFQASHKLKAESGAAGVSMGQLQTCIRVILAEVEEVMVQAQELREGKRKAKSLLCSATKNTVGTSFKGPKIEMRRKLGDLRLAHKTMVEVVGSKLRWCMDIFGTESSSEPDGMRPPIREEAT
ncbi:uncharacterized protein BDZ99DRAFT_551283 [Mytilinidion resinicola]|uniref:F-box domain-containing protein n=1 Tax=Mytilinidion resinicola TaxID=574789 RepID=A0A6A6Y1D5_9PEZI|nr:uncharacterized protein BDZ99DRAFT_551283 [Mytilinidion resinicola]KAF2802460.1 hypothetical protein BDZ99DRAFT_551283 [Mytilinidion resinicola]